MWFNRTVLHAMESENHSAFSNLKVSIKKLSSRKDCNVRAALTMMKIVVLETQNFLDDPRIGQSRYEDDLKSFETCLIRILDCILLFEINFDRVTGGIIILVEIILSPNFIC